jgi:omega-amidase
MKMKNDENLTIAAIQTEIFWENKEKNIEHFGSLIDKIKGKIDVILLPEMFNTGFSINPSLAEKMDGKSINFLREKSKKKNAVILGTLMIEEKKKIYNRIICMYPDGTYKTYDKRHLFCLSNENKLLTKGEERPIFKIKNWKILPLICYDLRFSVWCKNKFSDNQYEYDLIINLANWPTIRSNAWKILLEARAIENQCYVIGLNRIGKDENEYYSGDSTYIDMKGDKKCYRDANKTFITTLNYNSLQEFRKTYPFANDWDKFKII